MHTTELDHKRNLESSPRDALARYSALLAATALAITLGACGDKKNRQAPDTHPSLLPSQSEAIRCTGMILRSVHGSLQIEPVLNRPFSDPEKVITTLIRVVPEPGDTRAQTEAKLEGRHDEAKHMRGTTYHVQSDAELEGLGRIVLWDFAGKTLPGDSRLTVPNGNPEIRCPAAPIATLPNSN